MIHLPKSAIELPAICFAIACLFVSAAPVLGEEPATPVIEVSGEGSIEIAPDMAMLSLGVVRQDKTARAAVAANNEAMAAVIAALKDGGIAAEDLQTSGFAIQPQVHYPKPSRDGGQEPPTIIGYQVTNNLTVRVRELAEVGAVLDTVIGLGVNTGGGIRFINDDPSSAIAKARARAVADAVAKARTLAQAAGVGLGPILEISEHAAPRPVAMGRQRLAMAAEAADAVPVETGRNRYTVTVNMRWAIEQ